MIFRTGSILIVGKCENEELFMIYEYIKDIFKRKLCANFINKIQLKKSLNLKKKYTKRYLLRKIHKKKKIINNSYERYYSLFLVKKF